MANDSKIIIDEIRVTFWPGVHLDDAKRAVAEMVRQTGKTMVIVFNDQEFVCRPLSKIEEKQKPVDIRGQVDKVFDGGSSIEDAIRAAPHLFPWLKT